MRLLVIKSLKIVQPSRQFRGCVEHVTHITPPYPKGALTDPTSMHALAIASFIHSFFPLPRMLPDLTVPKRSDTPCLLGKASGC